MTPSSTPIDSADTEGSDASVAKVSLAALFVTALVVAQVLAVKVLAIPFPSGFPVVGEAVLVPAGVLAYAITFLASDCYAELYGRHEAQVLINVAFTMNFVLLGLVWLAIIAPGSPAGVDPEAFGTVLGMSTNIVIGSLGAYLVSQNWDVLAFHAIRERTEGEHLWLRNLGSTATSQLIDTTVFIFLAFFLVPSVLDIGDALAPFVLFELLLGQYLLKVLIAVADTPFVYAVVGFVRSSDELPSRYPTSK